MVATFWVPNKCCDLDSIAWLCYAVLCCAKQWWQWLDLASIAWLCYACGSSSFNLVCLLPESPWT